MNTDWKSILKTVAPSLAGLVGGPLAATAVGALSQSLLGKDNGTQDEVAAAISGASPDTLLKIKQVEADLKTKLLDAGIQLEEIGATDRASARQRESIVKDKMVPTLAFIYTGLYFLTLWAVWRFGLPAEADTRAELQTLLGIITAAQMAILNYYFGSSAGSDKKNSIIEKALS